MTMVCASYILIAKEGLHLNAPVAYGLGGLITAAAALLCVRYAISYKKNNRICKEKED